MIRSLSLVLLAAPLFAQSLTVTTSTPVPGQLVSFVGANASTMSTVIPAGSSTASASASGSGNVSVAGVAFVDEELSFDRGRRISYQVSATNIMTIGPAGGQATVGYHELIIEVSSPVTRLVTLEATILNSATTGQATPLFDVGAGPGFISLPMGTRTIAVGPQPLQIRIRAQAEVQAFTVPAYLSGSVRASLTLDFTYERQILADQVLTGCSYSDQHVNAALTTNGIAVNAPFAPNLFAAVFGWSASPVALPSVDPFLLPCVLYPSVDVVVLVPQGGIQLEVPIAIRPVDFYVQGVELTAAGDLLTNDAYLVRALDVL